jgi:hypothetical protein
MIRAIILSVRAAVAATAIAFARGAGAVILTPGVVTPLPGTTVAADPSLAGTVVQDVLSPFTMTTSTGVATGEIQSRVVLAVDGTYDFYWRVFNDSTSAADISFFRLGDFKSSTYDANYRIDGLGDVAPVSAFLFVSPTPGFINFDFSDTSNPDGLAPGQSSFFMFLDTDATSYSRSAIADVASSGTFFASNEIATFSPGIPEPSTWAMMALGFAGLGFAGCRTSRKAAPVAA